MRVLWPVCSYQLFEIRHFCFAVAICDLVHDIKIIRDLC